MGPILRREANTKMLPAALLEGVTINLFLKDKNDTWIKTYTDKIKFLYEHEFVSKMQSDDHNDQHQVKIPYNIHVL